VSGANYSFKTFWTMILAPIESIPSRREPRVVVQFGVGALHERRYSTRWKRFPGLTRLDNPHT